MNFYEFVTRNDYISFTDAVHVLLPIYMNVHNWNVEDSIAVVYDRKCKYIKDNVLLKNIANKIIVGNIIYSEVLDPIGRNFHDQYGDVMTELNVKLSRVNVKSLVEFVVKDLNGTIYIPDELRLLVEENVMPAQSPNLGPKYDSKTDRLVCQGIARTLWDIEPNMTVKSMTNHNAIQVYGNGSQYRDPKTLTGWLSEVDPRPKNKRRGPKKKSEDSEELVNTP